MLLYPLLRDASQPVQTPFLASPVPRYEPYHRHFVFKTGHRELGQVTEPGLVYLPSSIDAYALDVRATDLSLDVFSSSQASFSCCSSCCWVFNSFFFFAFGCAAFVLHINASSWAISFSHSFLKPLAHA